MIPDPDPSTLNPDGKIPEDVTAVIIAAIQQYEQDRLDTLLAEAAKNYLSGDAEACEKMGIKFDQAIAKKDALNFLETYKKQLQEGYTEIQGEKVYWLEKKILGERQALFDLLAAGSTSQELVNYFDKQKSDAELLSRNESYYVLSIGVSTRYLSAGVEKVRWMNGSNPCEICAGLGGQVFSWDELPYQIPVHVRCQCYLLPALD